MEESLNRGAEMSITDELRGYVADNKAIYITPFAAKCLIGIADRIDAEHEKALVSSYLKGVFSDGELAENGFIRLPKDADGEHICAGDKLDGYGKTIEVVELRYGRSGWVLISRDGSIYADTFAFTHYHAPTVEDVLSEFAMEVAGKECMTVRSGVVDKYAAKLQLADDAE